MIIGIDFDNTLVDTVKTAKKYLDIFMPGNTLKSYHELSLEKEIEFFDKYSTIITENSQFFPGVKEAFAFFKENNIHPILITARNDKKQVIATKKLLENNNIIFDKCYFGNQYNGKCFNTKGEICQFENIDLMVDDMDNVLENVSLFNTKVLKYGQKSEKYPYALNWYDVIDFIRKEYYENS